MIWLNDEPHTPAQEQAFQKYMTNGGAWLGFHAVGYTEKKTNWPWYQTFLGGIWDAQAAPRPRGPGGGRSQPPGNEKPASDLRVAGERVVCLGPNPAENKDVRVLLTLAPSNFPIGIKDVLTGGNIPVVWTNTKYKMLYINMGHGDKIFTSQTHNRLIENWLLWLLGKQ